MADVLPLSQEASGDKPAGKHADAPTLFDPGMFPAKRRPLAQFLLDHNPCLLVSTVCMLLGCYLVNSALKEQDAVFKLMGLLGVVNVYELCIIPLGLALIRRTKGAARDGLWLLLFECLFLVNATFVNVDFGPGWSWPFHLGLFLLACLKVALLFRGLKMGLGLRTFGFFVLQLAVIYGMPVLFAAVQVDGVVSPRVMYGLWWIVGLLPPLYMWLAWKGGEQRWDRVQNVIRRTYVIAPWLLMVMHVSFSHWAHHSDFQIADISPALLGLALASTRFKLTGEVRALISLVPAVALICSAGNGGALHWAINPSGETETLLPLHLAAAGMLITYGFMMSPFHGRWAVVAVFFAWLGFVFQGWAYQLGRQGVQLAKGSHQMALEWTPATPLGWGVLSIIAAFVLLAIGSIIGLRRTTDRLSSA